MSPAPKKTPARKTPDKRGGAKKAPAKKTTPKKVPAKEPAPSASKTPVAASSDRCAQAIEFLTGKKIADIKPSALKPYADNWAICRCEELRDGMALIFLFAASIHGSLAIRLLRKAMDKPLDEGMTDDLVQAVNAADQADVLRGFSAWVVRRSAFTPQAHKSLYGWTCIIIKIVQHAEAARQAEVVTLDIKENAGLVKDAAAAKASDTSESADGEGGTIDAAAEAAGDASEAKTQAES